MALDVALTGGKGGREEGRGKKGRGREGKGGREGGGRREGEEMDRGRKNETHTSGFTNIVLLGGGVRVWI